MTVDWCKMDAEDADSIPAPHLRSILICLRLWLLRPPLIQLQCYIAPCLDLNVHCSGYPGLISPTPPERVTIISFTLAKVKQIICYGPIFKTFSSRQPWRRSAVGTSHYNCYSTLLKMLVCRLGAADTGLDQGPSQMENVGTFPTKCDHSRLLPFAPLHELSLYF